MPCNGNYPDLNFIINDVDGNGNDYNVTSTDYIEQVKREISPEFVSASNSHLNIFEGWFDLYTASGREWQ